MAGARPGVHMLQLKPVSVPEALVKGNKFIKWDDDASVGTPVTLRVDPKGYILYWKDQNKDMDCLDVSLIRDTRTGKHAKVPKDPRLRDTVTMGTSDVPLEDKMVSIAYGTDLVNISFLNFAANSKETAQLWTNELFNYATNLLALNASPLSFLEKCYTKLQLITNVDGKIPIRNIVRMFAQHKDDRKKVEKALEAARLPCGKNDQINPSKFTFEDFLSFYRHLCARQDVEKIFHELGAKKKPYLTAEQFVDFLNKKQRDPRLNEILYPYCDLKKAQSLIDQFEPNRSMSGKGHLSQDGFLRYLLSDDNTLIPFEKLDINEDMDQPLAHYFINSSHNTYLTGHQLTGKSSVEIYRQALLTGCRCVELDCWDGKGADEEPIITHGFTMCTEILFKEVVEAIAETAFKVSDYPVILSFENHCSPKQQAKMAQHCRNILGDALLVNPLESNPLEPKEPLPSPELLKGKVIIKNKKRHVHKCDLEQIIMSNHRRRSSVSSFGYGLAEDCKCCNASVNGSIKRGKTRAVHQASNTGSLSDKAIVEEDTEATETSEHYSPDRSTSVQSDDTLVPPVEPSTDMVSDTESESDVDEDDEEVVVMGEGEIVVDKKEKGTAGQEAEAGMEMSALVNYMQPARFHSFEYADNRNRSYECISFVETQATALLKEFPVDFVNFNKRQLSRIYPKGTRVDSSNYMPQIFWNAGCQLVALNFQTLDLAMQLNLGIFEYNGRTGYILKPDFMRRKDRQFDPFAESTVDGIVAGTVEVKVISGQFLSDKKVGTFVEVDMYGLPADTVRKKFKTKTIPGNGINPFYDEEPFVFRKVVLPNLATLRIAVYDENNKLLGHRALPVEGLRPGYRHICLRNELNQPQGIATLFVHITVRDYIPDAFADFAEALSNPIAYQSQLEKHSQQLAVLEEDFDVQDEATTEPEQLKEGITPLTRSKNLSVGSRQSQGVDSPVNLSRVGSLSRTSGGTKCSSVPSSPLHAVSHPMANASPENGAVKPPAPKIDLLQTTQLKDPDLLLTVTLETLKQNKQYLKLVAKRDKELELLCKKHEKIRMNQEEAHDHQEEKLLMSYMKSKSSAQKECRKSVRKASRRGGSTDEVTNKSEQQIASIVSEQEVKLMELRQSQTNTMIVMCREQYQQELDVKLRYVLQLYGMLQQLHAASRSQQLHRLDDIHNKEVNELKKKLELQTREEMKNLAKKHKEKNELARVKREANQKLINLAVQERQKLRDILEKRKADVELIYSNLDQEIKDEKTKVEKSLQDEFKERCAKMEEKYQSKLLSVSSDSSSNPALNAVTNIEMGNASDSNTGHGT